MKYSQALKVYLLLMVVFLIFYPLVASSYGILSFAGAALLGVMIWVHIFFVIGLVLKNHTFIDTAWGLSFVIVAHVSFWMQQTHTTIQWIVLAMVTLWGLRLFTHIMLRTVGKAEDPRYQQMRQKMQTEKRELLTTYLRIYLAQGLLAWIIAAPLVFINASQPTGIFPYYQIGIAVWIIGFLFEVIGDQQLKTFLAAKQNQGQIMTGGLWKYSRHPNYFGEASLWWGIFVIALSYQGGWLAFFGPLLITYLLLFVSGVPLAENLIRGLPGFDNYKRRTSMFIPWPPKN
jgi:steroid 5-alpha reductase family enzyme